MATPETAREPSMDQDATLLTSECQYTVTGLSPGDRYEFRIIPRNAVGTISPPSQSSGVIMTRDENGKHLQLISSVTKNIHAFKESMFLVPGV